MTHDLFTALRPLLAAEAGAEAPAAGADPGDLEQAVWLRLLEHLRAGGPPADPPAWLRRAVRSEARRGRRAARRERPYGGEPADADGATRAEGPAAPADAFGSDPEGRALDAAHRHTLHDAVRRLPGRCPGLLAALLSAKDLTYREIAGELGISQGSLGPERSRCLGCLRRLLAPEVAAREARG
ncbi:sigma-70 family RNA polymerase sigma factor [Streptomyces mangrovisoli]|uniref:RNA polymerase subunit sigma n=1 Tax=Streptomyces mangrovisoli TaxID=1428628 RepID=A0A1J4NW21_9ACTN|nr:sigma-70 family RNA polymerase sigma factor [Streptomyces mangrovisoli]OIJ66689.1 RNA polymerase subunit sigma [Streptomyces mangrovisoli]